MLKYDRQARAKEFKDNRSAWVINDPSGRLNSLSGAAPPLIVVLNESADPTTGDHTIWLLIVPTFGSHPSTTIGWHCLAGPYPFFKNRSAVHSVLLEWPGLLRPAPTESTRVWLAWA
jgi:hypothetical protein